MTEPARISRNKSGRFALQARLVIVVTLVEEISAMIKKILMLIVAAGLAAAAPANAADKILIGQSAGINTVPSLVAVHEGYFKQQGLDVELKPLARGGLAIEGLASGTLQFAESAHVPFMAAVSR